ncbi:hypothetical protein CAEBREN_14255 [Caenorhabditis brenneri]|uniref:RING-type domain-containing protein n=1 Tax=Caenorhabditis brenneri TaxID=135651 RepID=G0P470_CAEBE|nr:hypothetical protein CAEBREN_14255 [Caenorhabditis brenneri]
MAKRRLGGAALQAYNAKRRRDAAVAAAAGPMAEEPVVQDNEPVAQQAEQPAPPVEQAAPPVEQVAPRIQPAAPRVEQAAPPVEQAAPRAQPAAPRVQLAAPPIEEAAPRVQPADPPVEQAAPIPKTEEEITTEILTELAKKQKKYIDEAQNLLAIWNDRYTRLAYYESFLENVHKREANIMKLACRLKELNAECAALEKKEELLLERIHLMNEQIKRLEEVFKESGKYHGREIDIKQKKHVIQLNVPKFSAIDSEVNSFPTLNELLVNTELSAGILAPAALRQDDLDEIKWPEDIQYDAYSVHLAKDTELAKECGQRRQEMLVLCMKIKKSPYWYLMGMKEEIERLDQYPQIRVTRVKAHQDLIKVKHAKWKCLVTQIHIKKSTIAAFTAEEKRLAALQESRDAQFEKIRKQVNQEEYKCEICLRLMTHGDSSERCPKIFGNCGHTACAECMIQFVDPCVFNRLQWKCPECRTMSPKIFTNWTVMKKIHPEWQQKKIDIE